jgi:hypothetical protein
MPAWKQVASRMPCSSLSVNPRFGVTYRLHLQGRKNKLSKKPAWKHVANYFQAGFLLNLFFRPWRWRRYFPPKRWFTLNGLHCVTSQKMDTLHNHLCEKLISYKSYRVWPSKMLTKDHCLPYNTCPPLWHPIGRVEWNKTPAIVTGQ